MAAAPVRYRITWVKASLLLFVAVISWGAQALCDLTGVLAIVSSIIGVIVGMLLPFLTSLMGVRFTPKTTTTFISQAVIGILPFVDIFPSYVIGTAYIIHTSRSEDRKNAVLEAAQAQQRTEQRLAVFAARRRLEEEQLRAANESAEESFREAA